MRTAVGLLLLLSFNILPQGSPSTSKTGEIVLMAVRRSDDSMARLREALTDGDPRVRTAAARVTGATRARELWSPLSQALIAEQDRAAATEQVRAMLLLQGATAVGVVEAQALRVGGSAARVLADWIAVNDAAGLRARLPSLADSVKAGRSTVQPAVSRAAAAAGLRHELLTEWAAIAPADEWKGTLQSVLRFDADIHLAEATLAAALRSSREIIREETAWFLLDALARGHSLPRGVVMSVERPEAVTGWESFGRELLVRYARRTGPLDGSSFLASARSIHRMRSLGRLKLLSGEEEAVIKRQNSSLLGEPPRPMNSGRPATARTVQVWMQGLIDDLASASGCSLPSASVAAVARVTYHADGRPKRVETAAENLPESCVPMFQALLATSLAEVDRPVTEDQQLIHLLPLSRDFATCTSRPLREIGRIGEDAGSGALRTPRKIKDVKPVYPLSMQRAGQQGVVVAEAVLSETGCVRELYVSNSSGAVALDLAAIEAVSQWQFEPTLLDGRPVPVVMTVSVNFTLR